MNGTSACTPATSVPVSSSPIPRSLSPLPRSTAYPCRRILPRECGQDELSRNRSSTACNPKSKDLPEPESRCYSRATNWFALPATEARSLPKSVQMLLRPHVHLPLDQRHHRNRQTGKIESRKFSPDEFR